MKIKWKIVAGLLFLLMYSCITSDNSKSKEIEQREDGTDLLLQSEALEKRKEDFNKVADSKTKKTYKEGLDEIINSGVLKHAKNVGDIAPEFTLLNAVGKDVSLYEYLKKGPVVLVWYRGGWCPYCNINLQYLQKELPNIQAQGATLLALTPELPDKSMNTSEKHHLQFEVLSDVGNKVARDYGVVFKLTEGVAGIYNDKFNLNEQNGDTTNELPLACTYIIDIDGKIVYSFLDADYRKRAEPSDITKFLIKMKSL